MLNEITFKTELSELLTLEEVVSPFDTIKKKSEVEMISLSIFPKFNKLREIFIKKATIQRNAELSKLLMEIANRKQEIKINIWKTLNIINTNKNKIEENPEKSEDLEQIIYEEEQIIGIYENSIKTLERKEQRIMNGKYSRVDQVKSLGKKRTLKKQLQELKQILSNINENHDNCFADYLNELDELIELSVISDKTKFPINFSKMTTDNYQNQQTLTIRAEETNDEEKMNYERKHELKDYYLYEPNEENLDDELIFQLLAQGNYNFKDGTINGLSLTDLEGM